MRWTWALIALLLCGCGDDETSESPPKDPLAAEYVLSSQDSVPEGIAFDATTRSFVVSSLNGGSITSVAADGTERVLVEAWNGRLVGLDVDSANRHLWACAGQEREVHLYDADSGHKLETFDLTAADPAASCNDVVSDGEATYVTDSGSPNVYRVEPGGPPTRFATDMRFSSPFLGLNGIVVSSDKSSIIVGHFSGGQLFTVNIADPTIITEIALDGDSLRTPDGLALLDGDLYSVNDTAVQRVKTNGATGNVTTTTVADTGLSTLAVAEGELFAIQSDTSNFVVAELTMMTYAANLPYRILRVDVGPLNP